jgi:hypothetical protein
VAEAGELQVRVVWDTAPGRCDWPVVVVSGEGVL